MSDVMTAADPCLLTLEEAAAAIRARKLSSVELTKALLARVATWQPRLNAFVRIDGDAALAAAADADAALARGALKGPLHGVPMAHKDMYYAAGKIAGCGSKIRADFVAPATSTALQRLTNAGALHFGALHMAEFAYGPTGHNVHLGRRAAMPGTGPRLHHRRLVVRLRHGGCGAVDAGGTRLRHRRLDPHAGAFLRRQRHQADHQPRQPRQRHAFVVQRSTRSARWPSTAEDCGLDHGTDRPAPIRSIR